MFCVLLGDGRSGVATRGDTGEAQKTKFTIVTGPRETEPAYATWGLCGRQRGGSSLIQAGRAEREREGSMSRCFSGGQGGAHKKRCKGISLVHLDVTRSCQGRERRGTYGKDQSCHTGTPGYGQGAFSLFGGEG